MEPVLNESVCRFNGWITSGVNRWRPTLWFYGSTSRPRCRGWNWSLKGASITKEYLRLITFSVHFATLLVISACQSSQGQERFGGRLEGCEACTAAIYGWFGEGQLAGQVA